MKLITLYFFACLCMNQTEVTGHQPLPDDNPIQITEQDPIPKATAIFWIDKNKKKEGETPELRTIKVKVNIAKDGVVKLISYVKVQHPNVENYIEACLKEFKVTKRMLNSGYIKPGEQYVQLRYIKENVKK